VLLLLKDCVKQLAVTLEHLKTLFFFFQIRGTFIHNSHPSSFIYDHFPILLIAMAAQQENPPKGAGLRFEPEQINAIQTGISHPTEPSCTLLKHDKPNICKILRCLFL
jgi:hypothetical protein